MKFKEVNYNDLKLGSKYVIIHNHFDKVYVGIFNGYSNKYTIGEISFWGKTYISYLNKINKKYLMGNIELNRYTYKRKYLVLESQREEIQNNMETRAINIILRRILGDNHFCY